MGDQSELNTTSSILSSKLLHNTISNKKSCVACCCMINKKDLLPVLDDVSEEFLYLANIGITQGEMICGNCLSELISACNFKRRCIFSNKKMKSTSVMTITNACNSASDTDEVPTISSKPCQSPSKKHRAESTKSLQSTNKITAGSDKTVGGNKNIDRVNGNRRRGFANKNHNKFASLQFPPHVITASDHGSNGSLLRSRSADNVANYYGKVCREVFSKMDDFKKHKSQHFSKLTNLFMSELEKPRAPMNSPSSIKPSPNTSANLREASGVCSFCGKLFKQLNRHLLVCPFVKQKGVKKQCERCGKVLTDLNKHKCSTERTSSTLSKTYPCDTCGKMLNSYKSLWSHKKYVHNFDSISKSKLDCLMCPKSYSNASARREHMITKHGTAPLPHACKTCSKLFPSTTKLKRHFNTHKNALSYECFICLASFPETSALMHHMKSNHNNILLAPNEITKTLRTKL